MMKSSRNNRLKASWTCPHCGEQITVNQFRSSADHPGCIVCPRQDCARPFHGRSRIVGGFGSNRLPTMFCAELHKCDHKSYTERSWRRVSSSIRFAKCFFKASLKTGASKPQSSATLANRVTDEWNLRSSG